VGHRFTAPGVPARRHPTGRPRKLLDVSRITGLGWKPQITLADGIADTVAWYRQTYLAS
jgi:nucleoside-diphosphate-sugar epimerase